jgi:hypothetical protein
MKEYTKEQIGDMREMLAQRSIDDWDEETIYDISMDGCVGYKNMPDKECVEEYENIYGELED